MEHTLATAEITIHAPVEKVWNALIDPALIKQYMFGTDTVSDWKEGSSITWKGEWEGTPYEDTGTVMEVDQNRLLKYEHISKGSDAHTVTITLSESEGTTTLTLVQDNNKDEAAAKQSTKNWMMMLEGLKKIVEG